MHSKKTVPCANSVTLLSVQWFNLWLSPWRRESENWYFLICLFFFTFTFPLFLLCKYCFYGLLDGYYSTKCQVLSTFAYKISSFFTISRQILCKCFFFLAGRIIGGLELPMDFSFFFKKNELCHESPKCFSSFRRTQEENWLSSQIIVFIMSFCLYVVA